MDNATKRLSIGVCEGCYSYTESRNFNLTLMCVSSCQLIHGGASLLEESYERQEVPFGCSRAELQAVATSLREL